MVEIIPAKLDRVRDNTAEQVNTEIDQKIEDSIRYYSTQPITSINCRIEELEKEWDIERMIEAMASSFIFIGTALGAFINEWFLVIPAFVSGFLFLHATQGWCPPVPILRRMGKRTRNEIDVEKFGLKALRGDFADLNLGNDSDKLAEKVIQSVRTQRLCSFRN